jgi:hypothetical protein
MTKIEIGKTYKFQISRTEPVKLANRYCGKEIFVGFGDSLDTGKNITRHYKFDQHNKTTVIGKVKEFRISKFFVEILLCGETLKIQ